MKKNKKAKAFISDTRTLKRVLRYIKPYRVFVVVSLLCAAISVAAQLIVPIFCGDAIDYMVGLGRVDFDAIITIIFYIGIVTLISSVAQWILAVCNNRITFCVSKDLRNAAIRKIQQLPLSYLDAHPAGDLVSRIIADVDVFADGLLMGFTQLFSGVLMILGTLGIMFYLNIAVTLVVVILTPLSLFTASFYCQTRLSLFSGTDCRPWSGDCADS